jgi:apolipoprotein N-acyltransferase
MAIVKCPACGKRISSLAKVCPHCGAGLGAMKPADLDQLARRRWRQQADRAANATYIALAMLVAGAIWWWGAPPQGWFMPPPVATIVLLPVGLALYLVGRSWLFWLRLPRNRPPPG